MDIQESIIGDLPMRSELIAHISNVVEFAHQQSIQVIYVVVGFRPGAPEVGEKNKAFSGMKERLLSMINPQPSILPQEGDIVVTKRRFSAFTGSDLDLILRANGIEHLVLCGVATSGVVLSTVREAADKEYCMTVLSDLCVDRDEEVQRMLLEKVIPRQADVITSREWMKSS